MRILLLPNEDIIAQFQTSPYQKRFSTTETELEIHWLSYIAKVI